MVAGVPKPVECGVRFSRDPQRCCVSAQTSPAALAGPQALESRRARCEALRMQSQFQYQKAIETVRAHRGNIYGNADIARCVRPAAPWPPPSKRRKARPLGCRPPALLGPSASSLVPAPHQALASCWRQHCSDAPIGSHPALLHPTLLPAPTPHAHPAGMCPSSSRSR
jgi:hypothetical protein